MTYTPQLPIADNNPLDEVDPQALQELFSRDPNELSSQDIDTIIAQFRKMRHLWEQEEASAKKQGRRANSRVTSGTKAKTNKKLDLNDLNLTL